MDLSDNAGVFILVIIVGVALLMLAANRMGKQASVIFFVALIGEFVGIWFCGLFDFEDASLEAVLTLMLSSLLPASIIICRWFFQFIEDSRERKIQVLKISIIEDFESRKSKLCMEKELLEKDLLINNSMHNLLMLLQSCVSTNLFFYENQELHINREKRNELLRRINGIEKELNSIDSRINDLQFNNIYSQLLRIKRGDRK